ncbi:PucR family transcriptional regulator [Cryptosporangium sp. NPDC051539]|uniref:PucR family transcriptional regulator n=1 Tax=Cryptosporangium sp. NPDC051539 TaxID=3363962 RepID=UPI0037A23506
MPSAVEVLADLGENLVRIVGVGAPVDVTHVHVYDGEARPAPGALVAAVGVRALPEAVPVAGVVFSDPGADVPGVTVGTLEGGTDWATFIAAATSALQGQPPGDSLDLHPRLFELADQVADLLGAPVTIEDSRHRVVAYSAGEGPHDDARTQSIMGRAVPAEFVTRLRAMGAFRRLLASDEPFFVPAAAPDFLQRLVLPLRLGPETLGSIWAIREDGLTEEVRRRVRQPARTIALCLLRLRAHENSAGRYSVEQVRTALATAADTDLALPGDTTRVVALSRWEGTSAADDISVWRTTFRRHAWAHPILADLDGQVFALVTDGATAGGWEWLRALSERGDLGVVGASRPASTTASLPDRRAEASEVLRAAAAAGSSAASYEEVWASIVIRRGSQAVGTGARDDLRDLPDHLAETLLAWLLAWGDYARTARELRIHPNTVRQRMRRIREVLDLLDLEDPEQRLALTLILAR